METAERIRVFRRRIRKARMLPPGTRLHHAVEPIYRRVPSPYVALAAKRLGLPARDVVRFFNEGLHGEPNRRVNEADADVGGNIGAVPAALLYALVRMLKPAVMVETGVANGMSSTFILAAMRANARGRLISIDLPFSERDGEPLAIIEGTTIDKAQWSPIAQGREHGWLVPEEYRDRWDLRAGDARTLLPAALEELGAIDVFLHDSLHTLDHMLFEFETAWPYISPGGLLVTDDLGRKMTDPLQRFSKRIGLPYVVLGDVGFIRKPT